MGSRYWQWRGIVETTFWNRLSNSTLYDIAEAIGVRKSPAYAASDIAEAIGPEPTLEFVYDHWYVLRDGWLSRSPYERRAIIDRCWSAGLGDRSTRLTSKSDEMTYLGSMRRSQTLSSIVLDVMMSVGSGRPDAPDERPPTFDEVIDRVQAVIGGMTEANLAFYDFVLLRLAEGITAGIELPPAEPAELAGQITLQVLYSLALAPAAEDAPAAGLDHHAAVLAGAARVRQDRARVIGLVGWMTTMLGTSLAARGSDSTGLDREIAALPFVYLGAEDPAQVRPEDVQRVRDGHEKLIEAVGDGSEDVDVGTEFSTLHELVTALMSPVPGASGPMTAADGDLRWTVTVGSAVVVVSALGGGDQMPPLVRLQAELVTGISITEPLLRALNDVNARDSFHKVYAVEDRVVLEYDYVAASLHATEFNWLLSGFMSTADSYDSTLRERFGGAVKGRDVTASFDA